MLWWIWRNAGQQCWFPWLRGTDNSKCWYLVAFICITFQVTILVVIFSWICLGQRWYLLMFRCCTSEEWAYWKWVMNFTCIWEPYQSGVYEGTLACFLNSVVVLNFSELKSFLSMRYSLMCICIVKWKQYKSWLGEKLCSNYNRNTRWSFGYAGHGIWCNWFGRTCIEAPYNWY